MRRKFTDTLKSRPKEVRDKSLAQVGLDYCDRRFHLESVFAAEKLSFQRRYQARLERSKPVAERFFAWAKAEYEKNPVPKNMLGAALTYAVRSFAVGRKNWLFSNNPKGADASAVVYSIVETAKANGLRPFHLKKLLLERLPLGVAAEACLLWDDSV